MTEEARSIYIYDLDPKQVSTTDIHDWLSQTSTNAVQAVTIRYDATQRQSCFRVVMATVELANAVLNHLDGQVFKSGPARIVSTVYSKALSTTLTGGPPTAAVSALHSGKAGVGGNAVVESASLAVSDTLPSNHLAPAHYQLMPQLVAWAERLKKGVSAGDGEAGGACNNNNSSGNGTLLAKVAKLAALQERLVALTLRRDQLSEEAASHRPVAEGEDGEGAPTAPRSIMSSGRRVAAPTATAAADGVTGSAPLPIGSSSSCLSSADPMTAAASHVKEAMRSEQCGCLVEVRDALSSASIPDLGKLVSLVTRVVGPVAGTTLTTTSAREGGGMSLFIDMCYAEDAEALGRLGSMIGLRDGPNGGGGVVGGGGGGGGKNRLALPAMRTALATATIPHYNRGMMNVSAPNNNTANTCAKASLIVADAGVLLRRLMHLDHGSNAVGGDEEALGAVSIYKERLGLLQQMTAFGRPSAQMQGVVVNKRVHAAVAAGAAAYPLIHPSSSAAEEGKVMSASDTLLKDLCDLLTF